MQRMVAASLLAKLLAVLILAVASGFGAGSRSAQSAGEEAQFGRAPSVPLRSHSRPGGAWDATGEALVARGIANESAGDALKRRWLFRTACSGSDCRTVFLRTSAYGTQRAELLAHRGYFTATFGPIAVGCEGLRGLPGSFRAHFKLWWSTDRRKLIADERGVYAAGKCDPGESRTRWAAIPAAP